MLILYSFIKSQDHRSEKRKSAVLDLKGMLVRWDQYEMSKMTHFLFY